MISGSGVSFADPGSAVTTVTLTGGNATIRANFGLRIETVAGNGTPGYSGDGGAATSAMLSSPRGICVQSTGEIYIGDNDGSVIRKVNASGVISRVAGTAGTSGDTGDGGLATAAFLSHPTCVARDSAGNLFIADAWNNRIRKVDPATGAISTVAGNGTASFSGDGGPATAASLGYSPMGRIAVGPSGKLYIADQTSNRIRTIP